jgi:hypothetical protein
MARVTQAEFARLAGVNRSTVHRWIASGRIEADAQGLIDPEAAARMREATESPLPHHQARKAQLDAEKDAGMADAEAGDEGIDSEGVASTGQISKDEALHRRLVASMKKAEEDAHEAKVKNLKLCGELVESAKIEAAFENAIVILFSTLDSLPDRISSELAAKKGDATAIHHILSNAILDLRRDVHSQFKRRCESE